MTIGLDWMNMSLQIILNKFKKPLNIFFNKSTNAGEVMEGFFNKFRTNQ